MNFLYFFIFYQSTALSSHGGSVVGKTSTIGIEISPTPPLIITGSQKVRNLAMFSTSLNFEQPVFENAARYPNSEKNFLCSPDHTVSLESLKLGSRTPENCQAEMPHPKNSTVSCTSIVWFLTVLFSMQVGHMYYFYLDTRSQQNITYQE